LGSGAKYELWVLLQVFSMGDIKPNKVADPEARSALVWILGQFGKHLESKHQALCGHC
jgi:hypothetical protein